MRSGCAVFLVGFMGAGKTSVGRALSQRLGWRFEDLDDRIRAREKCTIEAIFRDSGEAEFRRAEHAAFRELLAELPSSPPLIAALGGGAFAHEQTAELLASAGAPVVFLDGPVEKLWQRCTAEVDQRPLRRDPEQFRQLYETRRPSYLRATHCIDTGNKDVETVAAEIIDLLRLRSKVDQGKES